MLSEDININSVIDDMIANDQMFSSIDVVNIIQDTIEDDVLHQDVKEVIRSMFEINEMPSDYTRTLTSVTNPDNSHITIWVYHPKWKNVKDYHPRSF